MKRLPFSEICQRWPVFLREHFGVSDFEEKKLSGSDDLKWAFPIEDSELVLGDFAIGCVFSASCSEGCTLGIVGDHGYLAIGGSASGSNLILKIKGENAGLCKWIAPQWEYLENHEFHDFTSSFLGDPECVLKEMMDQRIQYYKDTDFGSDDDR